MEPRKKVVRFHPALDILLLREVISINPDSRQTWDLAHRNINAALQQQRPDCCVTLRTCRDRLRTLRDAHRRGDSSSVACARMAGLLTLCWGAYASTASFSWGSTFFVSIFSIVLIIFSAASFSLSQFSSLNSSS